MRSPSRFDVGDATSLRDRLGRALFGDRIGLVLFLGCLCFVTLSWRVGFFITDNITLEAGLRALADGRAWIEPATGDFLRSPGTNVRDGLVYGRNYGQLVVALPALWGLQLLAAVADLRVALLAGWHLLALALAVQLGAVLGRRRPATLGGSVVVLASFFANVGLATAFAAPSLPLLALQATSAVATGLVAVFLYRVLARKQDRRTGLLAGAGAVVAMPLGFWATVPKRHAFSALVCVALLYAFVRSREDGGTTVPVLGTVPGYRALAYALVGFLAWIHAAEGLFVFFALVLVDVPTAPSNDARSLAAVGMAFGLSMLPFLLTNLLVTGELHSPPRTLSGGGLAGATQGLSAVPGGAGGGGGGLFAPLVDVLHTVLPGPALALYYRVTDMLWAGLDGLTQTRRVYRTFVHSSIEGIDQNPRFLGVNLALLEAAPVLGALTGGTLWTARSRLGSARRRVDPADVLAVLLAAGLVVVYIPRLPLNTQITVRYLLPLYPLGAYALVRSRPVRRLADEHLSAALWAYAGGVLVGGQLFLAYVLVGGYTAAEAARLHALCGVTLGVALGVLSLGSVLDDRLRTPTAAVLGLAAAAGTVFLLLTGLHYFSFVGEYVLPVVGALGDLLAAAG